MSFIDALKKWNGGILRGAQTRFAKVLGVSNKTVSLWASGSFLPGETQIPKIAMALGISEREAWSLFKKSPPHDSGEIAELKARDAELREMIQLLHDQVREIQNQLSTFPRRVVLGAHPKK